MPLKLTGNSSLQAAPTGVLYGASPVSYSVWMRIDAQDDWHDQFRQLSNGGYNHTYIDFSSDALTFRSYTTDASGVTHDAFYKGGGPFVPGRPYHVAIVTADGTPRLYIDGRLIWSTSQPGTEGHAGWSGPYPFIIGCYDGISISFQDPAIWAGYGLTQDDVLALRDRSKNPGQIGGAGALKWWLKLDGAAGSTASLGDAALADQSSSGLNVASIVNQSGGAPAVAPVYTSGTMTYTPPARVSSVFVTPSRQGIVFFFEDMANRPANVASFEAKATLTTASLNGGAPFDLTDGIWGVTQPAYEPFVYYPLSGTIPPSDSPTVTAPDAWVVTDVGPVGALSAYPVDNSGKPILPPFDGGPKTMPVGYNVVGPVAYYNVQTIYSNFAKRIGFWNGADAWFDAQGYPNPTSGSPSTAITWNVSDGSADGKGPLMCPPSGTWTVMWDGAGCDVNDPTRPYLALNNGGEPSTTISAPTAVSLAPPGQTRANNKITQQVTQDTSARWTPMVFLGVNGPHSVPFKNLRVFPPGLDEDSPTFHPLYLEKLSGARCIRAMGLCGGDNPIVDFSDYPPEDFVGYSLARIWPGGQVVSVGPTSPDVQKYFPGGGSVLITFASPHGYKSGQKCSPYIPGPLPSVDGSGVGAFPTNTGGGAIELSWNAAYYCVAIDDHSIALPNGYHANGVTCTIDKTYYAPDPHPTDGKWACNGPGVEGVVPPGQAADLANAVGCDLYFDVPPAATDACVASIFDVLAARLAPGRKIYMEYGNEVWNNTAPGASYPWCSFNGNYEGINYAEWYAKRYGQVLAIARARMQAAGRGGDVLGVLGGISAWADGPSATMVNYCAAHGIPVDRLAIAPYFSNRDMKAPGLAGEWSLVSIWDSLNPEQIMDMGELHVVHGHIEDNVRANGALIGPGTAFPDAKLMCYEGGPEEGLKIQGSSDGHAHDRKMIWSRHPRFRGIMLHYLQILQDNGVDLFNDYMVGIGYNFASGWSWDAYYAYAMRPGKGDGSDGQYDNRTNWANYPTIHWDYPNLVSVTGGAINTWNSLVPVPTVTCETPVPGATGVSTAALVMATFSASVRPGSITLTLTDPHNVTVPGVVSYSDATHTVTLAPTGPLSPSTTYIATLSGATDQAGNTMAGPVTWSFTTASSWTQTTAADFGKGINNGTTVTNTSGGQVQLAPALYDDFDGSRLGPAWTSTSLESSASVVVSGGILKIRDAQVFSKQASSPAPVEARIDFGAALYQDFGLATGLSTAGSNYWAVFGTKDSTNTLYARVNVSGNTSIVNLGALPTGYHTYKVAPVPGGFAFSIDGVAKAMIPASIPPWAQLRVALDADQTASQPPMQIDWVRLGAYVSSGTFTSSVFDAGRTATWGTASWTANVSIGTSLIVETSSGNTATPDGTWSAWAAVSNGGTVASPASRYIHYRLRLATSEPAASPILDDIIIRWS